ncbi:BamA/TamA family outer membrane protein [Aurantibacillus circumpalustris]|uniref:BamA/TamA family outer membrane protein n=1 Tax=Aurantibacillus circumpalustris TaxID=3036359 RepID=UPI00295C320F|nr:BamA/TamA family outer membrane protein [Aurantibacillus circumpalustris]
MNAKSQSVSLKIKSKEHKSPATKLNYRKKFPTKSEARKEVENILLTLQYKGYLLAAADSVLTDSLSITAFISENALYKTAHLKLGNLDPGLASKLGISEKLYFNKPFRYREVAKSLEKIIIYYENNGYPFTSVNLDSVTTINNELSAVFNVQKNKQFKIDSIKIVGTAKINSGFINRYLSIKPKMTYNEEIVKSISQKIRQLPFINEKQTQRVQLTDRTNKLILFLDKKNASQFDGILGLLPDADSKKTIITGDLKLKVINGILRNGETFDLEWRRLRSQTQDFNGRIIYPFLLGSPIGVDYAIKIYRKDTTFIDITNNIGLQYYFKGLNNIKVFYKQRTNNLISTSGLTYITTLPEYADISTNAYGAGIFLEKLDYRFNPRRGVALTLNGQTGTRTIKKNSKVNEVAYNGLLLRSTQFQFDGSAAAYINIKGNSVLKFGVQAASVFGNSTIFKNELFRIGGLKTLRGFDEESIFTSTYVIPTLEYRFLFAQNSNLLLFVEGAWYENNSNKQYVKDTPISAGAGVNFETKAGILSINYALGNQFGNGFDLRNGKIHFGLTALF